MQILLECICASVHNDCSIKPHCVFVASFAMYEYQYFVKNFPLSYNADIMLNALRNHYIYASSHNYIAAPRKTNQVGIKYS